MDLVIQEQHLQQTERWFPKYDVHDFWTLLFQPIFKPWNLSKSKDFIQLNLAEEQLRWNNFAEKPLPLFCYHIKTHD